MGSEYRLTLRLEGGDLADLFRGRRDGQQQVVIKLFHPNTSDQRYARVIADTERQLTSATHPGLLHVLEIGTLQKRLTIVREDRGRYTLGQVLQRLQTKEVVLPAALAIAYLIELLECVQHAHDLGVVHGALTPGNVLVTAEGRPAVCDFGALAALNASVALKKNFGQKGRGAYRAPELSSGDAPSLQSDIYSLGAMAYELITLREAQVGSTRVRHEGLPPPSRLDRRLSSRLDPVVMRALEQHPQRRYKAAGEMANALREFLLANGGLPSKEELKRFVEQLFPPQVGAPESSGPLPFDRGFSLDEVTGAGLEEADERSLVVAERRGFSRALQENEGTEELAAVTDSEVPTPIAEAPASAEWHAPPSAEPVARPKVEARASDMQRRLKRVEDFSIAADGDHALTEQMVMPADFGTASAVPRRQERVRAPPSIDAHPTMQQRLPHRAHMGVERMRYWVGVRRRWLWGAVFASGLALVFFVFGARRLSTDASQQLPTKPLVRSLPGPDARPTEPKPAVRREVANRDCYAASKRAPGFMQVMSTRAVTVFIDGERVCGNLSNVSVDPGVRKVLALDPRTQESTQTELKFEAGKTIHFTPGFKTR